LVNEIILYYDARSKKHQIRIPSNMAILLIRHVYKSPSWHIKILMTSLTFQFVASNTNVAGFLCFMLVYESTFVKFTVILRLYKWREIFLESKVKPRHERDAFFVSARLEEMSVPPLVRESAFSWRHISGEAGESAGDTCFFPDTLSSWCYTFRFERGSYTCLRRL
jgi:hypothetical protein